jgi:microcystin-dependent protein
MSDYYIGEIRMAGFGFTPQGWAFCDGQLLPISQNVALFSLLGTTYGGDGIRTFALPNLTNRIPIGISDQYLIGEMGGEDAHELTVAEMPAHSHNLQASMSAGRSQAPSDAVLAATSRRTAYAAGAPSASLAAGSIDPTGGDQAHENRAPFLNVNFMIALTGIFPQRG